MNWVRLNYLQLGVKNHIVHPELVELVKDRVIQNQGIEPVDEQIINKLNIDPGGMLCMNYEPKEFQVGNLSFSVRVEHVIHSLRVWDNYKVSRGLTQSGDRILKVYLNHFSVAVMPEKIWSQVREWLNSNVEESYIARLEINQSLSRHPSIHVPSFSVGEA